MCDTESASIPAERLRRLRPLPLIGVIRLVTTSIAAAAIAAAPYATAGAAPRQRVTPHAVAEIVPAEKLRGRLRRSVRVLHHRAERSPDPAAARLDGRQPAGDPCALRAMAPPVCRLPGRVRRGHALPDATGARGDARHDQAVGTRARVAA